MRTTVKRSKTQYLIDAINDYKDQHPGVFDMHNVARWMIDQGLYERGKTSLVNQCAKELSRAARQEYYTDPQGRRVRKKHARREFRETETGTRQYVLWADIEEAPPDHMRVALAQRRKAILGDCKQLKTDVDSYNDNNKHGAQLEFDFDFNEDLTELTMPTEYPDRR